MVKITASIFGVMLIVIGILGCLPETSPYSLLFGYFHVNYVNNTMHIVIGLIGLICGIAGRRAARLFFQITGIFYEIIAVLGFYFGDRPIFSILANNFYDAFLHAAFAIIALYFGFGYITYSSYPSALQNLLKLNQD